MKICLKKKSTFKDFGDGDSTGCCPVVTAQGIIEALNQLEATGMSVLTTGMNGLVWRIH